MVFPIIPVLSTVIGAVGTIASINAQNQQARQQNAAIQAQISSNKRSEEIRLAGARFQEYIVKQQHKLEGTARRAAFLKQQQDLQELALREAVAAENEMTDRNIQTEQLGYATEQQIRESNQQVRDVTRAGQDSVTQATRQVAGAFGQASDAASGVLGQLVQAQREQRGMYAQLSAMGSRSSKDARYDRGVEAEVLATQKRAQEAAYETLNAIADTERVAALQVENERISQGAGQVALSNYLEAQRRNTIIGNQARAAESVAFARQAQLAQQMGRISNRIQSRQATVDRLLQQAGLVTGYEAAAAQAAAERARLESQKVGGVGFLQGAAQLLSAGTPLMSLINTTTGNQSVASPLINQPPPGYAPQAHGPLPPVTWGQPLPGSTRQPTITFGQPLSSRITHMPPSPSRLTPFQNQYNMR